jgi:hypothetical protein
VISADTDAGCFEREWEGDQDVLRSLAEQGDRSDEPRKIDVSFQGEKLALDALGERAGEYNIDILNRSEMEEGGPGLFSDRLQATGAEAIRNLTITCLQIERRPRVAYDGWGCMAQNGSND